MNISMNIVVEFYYTLSLRTDSLECNYIKFGSLQQQYTHPNAKAFYQPSHSSWAQGWSWPGPRCKAVNL